MPSVTNGWLAGPKHMLRWLKPLGHFKSISKSPGGELLVSWELREHEAINLTTQQLYSKMNVLKYLRFICRLEYFEFVVTDTLNQREFPKMKKIKVSTYKSWWGSGFRAQRPYYKDQDWHSDLFPYSVLQKYRLILPPEISYQPKKSWSEHPYKRVKPAHYSKFGLQQLV